MKRAGWVLLILFCAPALRALEVQVGSSFAIKHISRTGGAVQLPVERKKYYNIRILDKQTLAFVQHCTEPCVQPVEDIFFTVYEVRPAQTRPDMWMVSLDFNRAWLVTFLLIKKGDEFTVKSPADFSFLDEALQKQTYETIKHAAENLK